LSSLYTEKISKGRQKIKIIQLKRHRPHRLREIWKIGYRIKGFPPLIETV
jgi:hypothetical protein